MSPGEIGAIVVGLIGGFWLVSRVMDGSKSADPTRWTVGDGTHSGPTPDQPGPAPVDDAALPWWVVLDVPRIATRDEVSHAYKRKISEYHPDKVAQMGAEIRALAEAKSKTINAAYDEAMRSL